MDVINEFLNSAFFILGDSFLDILHLDKLNDLLLPLLDVLLEALHRLGLLLEYLLQLEKLLLKVLDLLFLWLKGGFHFLGAMGEDLLGFLEVLDAELVLVKLVFLFLQGLLDFTLGLL